MAQDKLTDVLIRNAKPGEKAQKLFDGGGLYLELRPNGAKYWRLKYRVSGVEKRLSLGVYPATGLKDARAKAAEARKLVAEGADPSEQRQADKADLQRKREAERLADAGLPPVDSFEAVARDWLKTVHEVKVSAGHAERTRIRLEQDAFPWIGRRPIAELEAPELLEMLRRVEARGAVETAHRIKDACGQVFRYGVATGACKRNPAADLKDAMQPVQTRHHAAIVDPVQVGKLLRDLRGYSGHVVTRAALELSALLLLRPGELRHMEWAWVDLAGAMLTLPPEVMKRKKADKVDGPPHLVPLPLQAVEQLTELERLTGSGRFVFPALTSGQRCMSENTVRSALRRLGYGNEDMTAHGFRATARTMIAERLGIAPEVIEAQLAHAVGDALGRAYNRTQYLAQRQAMMQTWADYLDKLRQGAEVVPIQGRAA
ncbi:tyrosine-type recombinase/integrase [Paucibacter sp. Y2R2-4]|uniref:tyrosine-type recombinase/integrase n=1 Tax=Paucibacter sp. Y2R2-4 TaxID=2893553 RepID=UPI0021E4BF22|nr:integrase arm-type DNA-binding domain-containing protein [Paucibacter sp. Y2R2-4]MCV2348713.1 integrase arm-type DNA-binding domain-containing protein [Paucibacter sp. Y2R2-4]